MPGGARPVGVPRRAASVSSAARTQPLAREPKERSLPDHICLGAPKGMGSGWGIHEKSPEAVCFLRLHPVWRGLTRPLRRCLRAWALGPQSSHSVTAVVCCLQPAHPPQVAADTAPRS